MIFNNMKRYNPLVSIYTGKINKDEAEMDQVHLLKNLVGFNNRSRPKTTEGTDKKKDKWKCICSLWRSRINFECFQKRNISIKSNKW